MKRKVIFRTDFNSEIGLGHVVRCMALASALEEDYAIAFVCRFGVKTVIDKLKEKYSLHIIETEEQFWDLLKGEEIVVLDGYHFDFEYQENITRKKSVLVCVDDLADRRFCSDVIINHNPGITPGIYSALPFTEYALGLDYAMLRRPFLQAASQPGNLRDDSILICFGGSDPRNLTAVVIGETLKYSYIKSVNVVVGAGYAHGASLGPYLNDQRVTIYRDISDVEMASLMLTSSVAVVPASGVLLEALACRCHVISGTYVENQTRLYDAFRKVNAFVDAGDFSSDKIRTALERITADRTLPDITIDGKSGDRFRKLFRGLELFWLLDIRRARETDIGITYKWATSSTVRAYSFNKETIQLDDHKRWFTSKIADKNCFYFIGLMQDNEIGSIRFDVKGDEAIISYLLDPECHGRGLGLALLKTGIKELTSTTSSITKLTGYVMHENQSSIRIFQKLGFNMIETEQSLKFQKII